MHPTDGFDYGSDHLTGHYDSAPTGSGTNGSHSLDQPCSTLPLASKASDRIAILKAEMIRQGII
jgi:hypothetical protein